MVQYNAFVLELFSAFLISELLVFLQWGSYTNTVTLFQQLDRGLHLAQNGLWWS